MTFEYLQRAVMATKELDAAKLGHARLGRLAAGGNYNFFPLLGVDLQGMSLGIKILKSDGTGLSGTADTRMRMEGSAISLLTSAVTGLMDKVPYFIARLTMDGVPAATITEDASAGGTYPVHGQRLSVDARQQLASVFCSEGQALSTVFDTEELDKTMAFSVNGKERLLDFTPSPFVDTSLGNTVLKTHVDMVSELLEELSVDIASDSPLGLSLLPAARA